MQLFFATTVFGLYIGSAYAIAASGLVLTYSTTRVFNLAHGAISMVMAFVFWQLSVSAGLPVWLAVLLVVLVIAPLFGLALGRIMRGLGEAPVTVSLVVTVALFMAMIGAATQLWPSSTNRSVPYFFGYRSAHLFGVNVGYHYLLTILVSVLVAAALWFLLNRTLIGTAMRAAVDNAELLQLFGAESGRVSAFSWALGSSMAALAGVMLAAYTGLNYYSLTFLVIAAFAAAMLGQLKSLPLTYVGAIILGLGGAYIQNYAWQNSPEVQAGMQSSLPTFLLFAILVLMPQVRLRVGQVKGIVSARIPSAPRSAGAGVALVVAGLGLLQVLDAAKVQDFGLAVAFGIVMLSMVLLTGYGGYLSLAQFSFVGVGAATVAKMNTTSPLAIVVAVVLAAAVGALVALPVLRLTGLYLALATLAFGQLMDKLVFSSNHVFGANGSLPVKRVSVLGYGFGSDRAYVVVLLVLFVLLGLGILTLRRGPLGRLLLALRDSPQAAGTLGLNQRWLRVALFSASAGIAGFAGALMAGLQEIAAPGSFATIASLPTVLVAVVAGVTTVSGALVGGVLLMITLTTTGGPQGMIFIVLAIGAILLARDPNGLVNLGYTGLRGIAGRLPGRVSARVAGRHAEPLEVGAGHGVA
jgi:branched-chain amino acid transport system permease protein